MNYNIKETEKAYLAGLFDGEGCVFINKGKKQKENYVDNYSLKVTFSINYVKSLYDIKNIFGGTVTKEDMDKRKNSPSIKKLCDAGCAHPENYKQKYHFQISGRDAWYFLKVIEVYCREKKEQACVAIEFFEGKRPNARKNGRSQSETDRCEFYYKKLQELKKQEFNSENKSDNTFVNSQKKIIFFDNE